MDRKTAEEFWTTYFGLIMHEGADTCMGNPFKEFIKEARIGTYDALTDDEYHVIPAGGRNLRILEWQEQKKCRTGFCGGTVPDTVIL